MEWNTYGVEHTHGLRSGIQTHSVIHREWDTHIE